MSFDSYIKPQQMAVTPELPLSCMSFDSYIKPQPIVMKLLIYSLLYFILQIRSGV